MSEKSVTTTTSFISSTNDGLDKPPLSSDSSIDSGCNSSTSDSIKSNHQYSLVSNQVSACSMTNHPHQNETRLNPLMLPTQPNVHPPLPPPPPPPPLSQLQDNFYPANDIYDNRASIYQRFPDHANNNDTNSNASNIYTTYASSCSTNIDNNSSHSSPIVLLTNQQPQQQQQQQPSPQSQIFQQTVISQRSSTSSLESASSLPLMPMNVKGMLLHGLPSEEVLRNWLSSLKCDEHIENFIYHGYDMHLVTRMTPQDLAAIGCKSPALRKKLLAEIKKLNLDYDIPEFDKSTNLDKWLESLKLYQYYNTFLAEGYDTVEKACQLTWEDLEEIGINKLGHQKRLLMAIDKIRKSAKQQEESQNDSAIYDVHPNHRISLNGASLDCRMGTIGRVRSGLFQTRSGANLDHRGLPIATVMPALKHVSSPILNQNINQQVTMQTQERPNPDHAENTSINGSIGSNNHTGQVNEQKQQQQQIYDSANHRMESMNLSDLSSTMKRNRPLPPVRTNSLKAPQVGVGTNSQPVYGNKYIATNGMNCNPNSTSFLRTPKLGTLTPTTNKMLTSGGHIQTLSAEQAPTNRSIFSPVREAPLPPNQLHHQQQQIIQSSIPEKIDEEPSIVVTGNDPMQTSYSVAIGANGSNMTFKNIPQLASSDEFPPAPPCQ
uniref:Caskin-1 n=1 Tax=Aceria tosichella TaxID=561515 RepID=A0A6G1SC04_9ACAR